MAGILCVTGAGSAGPCRQQDLCTVLTKLSPFLSGEENNPLS